MLHLQIDTFTASGTWTCPTGVTDIRIWCWGAGGGGSTNVGGGGGGAFAEIITFAVSAGNNYTVTVGTSAANTNGGDSSFNTTTCVAKGGLSGTNGGTGGTAAASTGDTKYSGGNGSIGTAARAGGGGAGSAGSASGSTGGTSDGGDGATTTSGSTGKNIGGGGGSQTAAQSAGAAGQVSIIYFIDVADRPVVSSRAWARTGTGTSHAVTMPSNIQAGDLLLIVGTFNSTPVADITGTEWTQLDQVFNTDVTVCMFYKYAKGNSQDSATITLNTSSNGLIYTYRISGAEGVPEFLVATNTTGNMNPPALTAQKGSKYLWIVAAGKDAGLTTDNLVNAPYTSGGNLYPNYYRFRTTGTGVGMGVQDRYDLSVPQYDPSTFTNSNDQWIAYTIGIRYAGSPAISKPKSALRLRPFAAGIAR